MSEYGLPLVYALFIWWFSTGAIFVLNGLPRRSFRWSMGGATLVLVAACFGLVASAARADTFNAYLAFTCGLTIWGWQTMTYYMGFITGPRDRACPSDAVGARRFGYGVAASLYHELVVLASAAAIIAMTWGQPNRVGLWTFLALWGMHVSAKLNVFLGVRNLNEEFLPDHLAYLRSYFRRRRMNPLFPISVTIGTAATVMLVEAALAVDATEFATAGYTLLATLVGLAVFEHWCLVLPLPVAALWRWCLRLRDSAPQPNLSSGKPQASGRRATARTDSAIESVAAVNLSGATYSNAERR